MFSQAVCSNLYLFDKNGDYDCVCDSHRTENHYLPVYLTLLINGARSFTRTQTHLEHQNSFRSNLESVCIATCSLDDIERC